MSEQMRALDALREALDDAMRQAMTARVPECGAFGAIAQNLDYAYPIIEAALRASATESHDDGDLTVAYMAGVYDERKRTFSECESAEIIRLREDCAEAYQVIGALAGDRFNDADVEKALDNIVAAANGTPRPHADVLPFSHQRTGKGEA